MVTFILPGYSAHNKDWALKAAEKLKIEGEIRPILWDHWTNPAKHFKAEEKARLISGLAGKRKVNILAKSVGTLVTAEVTLLIPSQIDKIILCGIPSTSAERLKIFQEAFSGINSQNIICFQNNGDPFVKPQEIKEFMSKVNPLIKVISKERSDHHYPYYQEFNDYLTS